MSVKAIEGYAIFNDNGEMYDVLYRGPHYEYKTLGVFHNRADARKFPEGKVKKVKIMVVG